MELREKILTEEQIMQKRHMLEEQEIMKDALVLDIDSYQKMIELKMPERRARNEMAKKQDQLKLTERNIKILETQIRTKTEKMLNPEN